MLICHVLVREDERRDVALDSASRVEDVRVVLPAKQELDDFVDYFHRFVV
jgi:hypothetical protein